LDALVYSIIDSRTAAMTQQQQQQQQDGAAVGSDSTTSSSSGSSSSGSGQAVKSDLLQALLESRDDSGRPMARTALRDELMTLLVAGEGAGWQ
jgi:cytochrome P450